MISLVIKLVLGLTGLLAIISSPSPQVLEHLEGDQTTFTEFLGHQRSQDVIG